MNQDTKPVVAGWYWVIAIVALLWNLTGCTFFAMELFAQEKIIESMTPEHQEWARSFPVWIYFLYGLAVFTGVGGSVGLLMRKGWSAILLVISLAAVIVQMFYTMIVVGGLEVMGASGAIMPAMVIVIAGFLVWFSYRGKGKGWSGD
jgi:hypothetical protein